MHLTKFFDESIFLKALENLLSVNRTFHMVKMIYQHV